MTEVCTLILSTVEQQCCVVHLDAAMRHVSDIHVDRELLRGLILELQRERTLSLTNAHVRVMLRHLRSRHALLDADMMGLEERVVRGGYDGTLDAAWHALDSDSVVLEDVIRRLWEMLV